MDQCEYLVYSEQDERPETASQEVINTMIVELSGGLWNNHNMEELCPYILQWKAIILNLGDNYSKTILKELKDIEFFDLKVLTLDKNKIETVEGMSKMYMPSLEELYLDRNNINSVQDFRKINSESLNLITLNDNKINEGKSLLVKNLQSLKYLTLDYQSENSPCFEDLRWIVKLQISTLSKLSIRSSSRIRQTPILKVLAKKYKNEINYN